jgi:type III secretion protein C
MKRIIICSYLFLAVAGAFADNIVPGNGDSNASISSPHTYFFRGDSLKVLLSNQAKQNGMNISFAKNLSKARLATTVSGRFSTTGYTDLLSQLSRLYGFNFYIYSGTVYITGNTEVTKSIAVAGENMPMLKNGLSDLGILDSRFGYTEFPAENKVVIRGPSSYVNAILNEINTLKIAPSTQQFAVYRLKYANATDIQLTFNNQQIVIPGVATILKNVLDGNQDISFGKNSLDSNVAEPIKNQTMNNGKTSNKSNATDSSNQNGTSSTGNGSVGNPLIQADDRLNTIVIRDKATNLEIYKHLISLLDVPSPLIQIEVLVIHLDQNQLKQAGINWWASKNGYGVGFGANNLSNTTPSSNISFYYGQINPGQLLVNNVNNFVTSLDYLSRHDIAQATARPSLATADNMPAVINVTENLYPNQPQNTGNNSSSGGTTTNSSSNTQIQVTTSLEITPHVIVDENNQYKIKLAINLQDGSFDDQTISGMPSTTQNTLTSQAVVNESQSIILGGYAKDVKEEVTSQVPFLGSIPLIGWFFKSTSSVNRRLTTLYLVTPRIYWIDNNRLKYDNYIMVNGNKFNIKNGYETIK